MKAYLDYKPASLLCGIDKIPAHWNEVRNGYFFKEKNDNVGNEWEITQLLSLTKQGIIKRDMNSGKGKTHSDYSTYQRIAIGDFIFCLFDIDETPRTVGLSELSGMITSAYTCFQINEKANGKFIYYLYEMIDDKKALKPFYSGMRKTIRATDFLKIKIPFPPLAEQQKIAQFLDTKTAQIDALITEQNRLIELLTEQRKAVISHAVTKGLNPNATMKKSGVEWLGEVPNHWQAVKSKNIFGQSSQRALKNDEQLTASQKYGVIPQRLFMEYENQKVVLALTGLDNFKHIDKNDFVISLRSFQGGIELCHYDGCVSPAYTVLKAKSEINNNYFAYLLKDVVYIQALNTAVIGIREGKNISYNNFGEIFIPFPPLAEQNEIVNYLDQQTAQIDALISEQKRLIERLKEYRTALISAAVTGKIDVQAA